MCIEMKIIVDKLEPATSSQLVWERSAAMKQLLETVASVDCTYHADTWNAIEEYELRARVDINEKESLTAVNALYNLQTDWSTDSSDYIIFVSRNVRNMASMREAVKAAYGHEFCSSRHFSLWHKALL